MKLRFYEYQGCDTCRRAKKFLAARALAFDTIPIREQPPTKAELNRMLAIYGGDLRRLFNTSGGDYKAMRLAERLPKLTVEDALALLAAILASFIATMPGLRILAMIAAALCVAAGATAQVSWLWIGGALYVVGGIFAWMPLVGPAPLRVAAS